ncbi:MAG: Slp family lipoprotein [Ectothiorhodospiraceae bacterium]|nr:Slp family lipoprotein [Ectothiorhodospiraceae bacterium]
MTRLALLFLCTLPVLAGCATGPGFPTEHVNTELVARAASATAEGARGERVIWGGRIIQTEPEDRETRMEVLAYPLQRNQKPDTTEGSQGRFLVVHPGYLEPADYAPDRLITVTGELDQPRKGRIGEAEYRYPVVHAEALHLWPREPQRVREEPRVRFGVGVMISR